MTETNTKSILASKTAWGAALGFIVTILAVFNIQITDAETQPVIEAFSAIFFFCFTIYGRIKAKVPAKFLGSGSANVFVVGFIAACMLSATLFNTGCAQLEEAAAKYPTATKIVTSFAQAALIAVINDQAETNDAIAEQAELLKQTVNEAFAGGADEATIAQLIAAGVYQLFPDDEEARSTLQAGMLEALSTESTDPASDQDRVRAALLKSYLESAFAAPQASAPAARHWSDPIFAATAWLSGVDSLAALKAYHSQPATAEELQASVDHMETTVGVSAEYAAWVNKQ